MSVAAPASEPSGASSIGPAAGRFRVALVGLLLALVGLVVFACTVGKYPVAPTDLLAALADRLGLPADSLPVAVKSVVWEIRLPRIAAALLVGAGLAASGASFQTMFRNPLVAPDILGVSAGAAFGAALGLSLGLPVAAVQLLAFAFGLLSVLTVFWVSRTVRGHEPTLVLVLTGVVVGALFGAGTSLLKVLADPYNTLPAIVFWLMGSLASTTAGDVGLAFPAMALGLAVLAAVRWRINLLALPDDEAASLGADVWRLRVLAIAAATLVTSAAVSISGVIGWIGLLVPHLSRFLVGPEFSRLLPISVAMGAGFLLLVDTMARTLAPMEIPLGILTSCLGAPVFLYLLIVSGRETS